MTKLGCTAALFCLALASALVLPRPAEACTLRVSGTHAIDPDEAAVDAVFPAAPSSVDVEVEWSRATVLRHGDSCNFDRRALWIRVAGASDDRTPFDELGYRLELEGGDVPAGFAWPEDPLRPVRTEEGEAEILLWLPVDGDLDVTFNARAVDRAGNESAPGPSVVVQDLVGSGCATAGGGGPGLAAMLLALAVAARPRPRAASGRPPA